MIRALAVALALGLGAPPAAQAAPVSRPVSLELVLDFAGMSTFIVYTGGGYYYRCMGCPLLSMEATGTVSVDPTAGTIGLAAGVLALTAPVRVGIDTTTALNSITIPALSNQAGMFSVGGAAGLPGEPGCPGTPGSACVGQSGLGGPMGLDGTINFVVVPTLVVIPVALGPANVGVGGSTNTPFTFDAAPWTVGTGVVLPPTGTASTVAGSVSTDSLRLVTPTFVNALGNQLPLIAELTITFTDGLGVPGFVLPEPGLLALLAFVGLGLFWRMR